MIRDEILKKIQSAQPIGSVQAQQVKLLGLKKHTKNSTKQLMRRFIQIVHDTPGVYSHGIPTYTKNEGLQLEYQYRHYIFHDYENTVLTKTEHHIPICAEVDLYKDGIAIEVKTGKHMKSYYKAQLQWLYFCGAKEVYLLRKTEDQDFYNPTFKYIPKDENYQNLFHMGLKRLYQSIRDNYLAI